MKKRKLIGIVLLLSSIISCDKIDSYSVAPEGYHYKDFGMVSTKSMSVTWSEGDSVCVYSLGEGDLILYKDTVEVTDVSRNAGKITALVDNDSEQYFITYPYNSIKSETGEALNDEDFRINLTGEFGDVSVMTQRIDTTVSSIYMSNRFSLLKLNTERYYGTVDVKSSFPTSSTVKKSKGKEYWIPLSYEKESVKVTIKTASSKNTTVREVTLDVKPGIIYCR